MAALELVLASASPRRRELLAALGVPFRTVVTDAEEERTAPAAIVARLPRCPVDLHDHPTLRAWRKADAAARQADAVVLGADTIVVLDGVVLNKPADPADAARMLRLLAGRDHTVYTGLALLVPGRAAEFGLCASAVSIAPLDDAQIAAYVATGEPLDKAGAYGAQGIGGRLVRQVTGSYTGVVGLPLTDTAALLSAAGIVPAVPPEAAYHRWIAAQGKEPLPCPPTLP